MEKNIKDYLPFYIGCECIIRYDWNNVEMKSTITSNSLNENVVFCKPILFLLSKMTAEQLLHVESLLPSDESIDDEDAIEMLKASAECTRWLLSKHFDLFGLIEAGLAIDKTTLNK